MQKSCSKIDARDVIANNLSFLSKEKRIWLHRTADYNELGRQDEEILFIMKDDVTMLSHSVFAY